MTPAHVSLATKLLAVATLVVSAGAALWRRVDPATRARWPRADHVVAFAIAALPDLEMLLRSLLGVLVPGAVLPPPTTLHPAQAFRPTGRGDGQAGVASVSTMLAVTCAVLGLAALVLLHGCLPPPDGCTPHAYRCAGDRPQVCSATARWTPVGDTTCAAAGGACALTTAGLAYCAPAAADGGAR